MSAGEGRGKDRTTTVCLQHPLGPGPSGMLFIPLETQKAGCRGTEQGPWSTRMETLCLCVHACVVHRHTRQCTLVHHLLYSLWIVTAALGKDA